MKPPAQPKLMSFYPLTLDALQDSIMYGVGRHASALSCHCFYTYYGLFVDPSCYGSVIFTVAVVLLFCASSLH